MSGPAPVSGYKTRPRLRLNKSGSRSSDRSSAPGSLGPLLARLRFAEGALLAALAWFTVMRWGDINQVLAFGDIFPYSLNPGKWFPSTLRLWNTTASGGGDLIYSGGVLLSSLLDWLPRTFGQSAGLVQRAELGLLLMGILLSTYNLPSQLGITARRFPRLLGSLAYTFNLELVMQVPDTLSYVSGLVVVLIPLLYSKVLRARGERLVIHVAIFALSGELLGYVFNNPPQLVADGILILVLCLFVFLHERPLASAMARSLAAVLALLVVNLWWVISASVTSLSSSVQKVATIDVSQWAWTHVNSSLLNSWSFTSSWAWPNAAYYPWSAYYTGPIMRILELWPMVAIASGMLVLRSLSRYSRHWTYLWVVVAIISALLVKGLHPPATDVNLWLYRHVPGFFLFREPTSKFSLAIALASSMSLVTIFDYLQMRWHRVRLIALGVPMLSLVVVSVMAFPSVSGSVTANFPERLAPLHVRMRLDVPSYWWRMSEYVNRLPKDGGIALLPNDDYYQMYYRWGYYGVDLLPQELFDRPVFHLYDSPQGYVTAGSDLARLDERLVQDLSTGKMGMLASTLGSQGVRYMLLRRDIVADIPGRHTLSPTILGEQLNGAPGIALVHTDGALDLYEIAPSLVRARIYATSQNVEVKSQPTLREISAAAWAGRTIVSAPAPTCGPETQARYVAGPTASIIHSDLDTYTVRVTATDAPILLVLNQSLNPGWQATVERVAASGRGSCDGAVLPHVQASGFANAWWLPRSSGTTLVRVTFTPQRRFDVGLGVSAVGILTAAGALVALAVKRFLRAL